MDVLSLSAIEANTSRPGPLHYDFLDGLRGLAILGVVLVHVSQLVAGLSKALSNLVHFGAFGVQLFFIISGLTFGLIYRNRSLNLRNFYIRRFFRIAPMFYLGGILYIIIGAMAHVRFASEHPTVLEILATATFLHGWSPGSIGKVVPGGWSIGAEAMFYVVLPFLLHSLGNRRFWFILLATFPLSTVGYVIISRLWPGSIDSVAFFAYCFWVTQLPAFVLGIAISRSDGTAVANVIHNPFIVCGGVLLLTFHATWLWTSPLMRANFALLITILLLGALVVSAYLTRPKWLEAPVLTWVGRISFSVYVLHFAFVDLAELWVPPLAKLVAPSAALWMTYAGVLAMTLAAAEVAHRWIEAPFIELSKRLTQRI